MEFGSRRNAEASKITEGVAGYTDKPKTFEQHMREMKSGKSLKEQLEMLLADDNAVNNEEKEYEKRKAEEKALNDVLATLRKINSPTKTRDLDQPKDLEGREFRLASNQNPDEEVETKIESPVSNAETDRQPDHIDNNVYRTLFGTPTNIRNMLGDQQFSKWQNIVNQDIESGKYAGAKYEDGLVYYIGKVNESSIDERGDDWDIMKYRSRDERLKYDEQVRDINPDVWKQIGKTIYALGATLGDNSREYHDALNKINQDIFDGRYKNAEYIVVRNEGEDTEEGIINFND